MTIEQDRSRLDYLRLRSALIDRITGLPALSLLFDEMRTMLDRRRSIGVIHVSSSNLPLVESVYGWRTYDRVVARQAEEVTRQIGGALPAGARLAQLGIHGAELIAVLPEQPDGREVDTLYVQGRARELEAALRALFEAAGLAQVDTGAVETEARFAGFNDYWEPFLRGTGPAPAFVASLEPAARDVLRERLRRRLPGASRGEIRLRARAWSVRGISA